MPAPLPQPPVGAPLNSHVWMEWFRKIYVAISNVAVVTWSNIDFTGSNLNDIQTRNHNDLQSMQGGAPGEYYHLTSAQQTSVANLSTSLAAKQNNIQYQDEGVNKGTAGGITTVNFTGSGVVASDSGTVLTVNVTGGGGGGGMSQPQVLARISLRV